MRVTRTSGGAVPTTIAAAIAVASALGGCRSAPGHRAVAFRPPIVSLEPSDTVRIESPVGSDCNRPAWWVGDTLFQMVSNQHPWRSRGGRDAATAQPFTPARFADDDPAFRWDDAKRWYVHDVNDPTGPTRTRMRWIESVFRRPRDGALFGLYHHEEGPYVRCPAPDERPYLSVAHVGLARSDDNGMTWHDLGLILSDGSFPVTCDLPVRFFAGGVGDPSMAVGPDSAHLYIAFTSYSGDDPVTQGIQLARLSLGDLDTPVAPDGTSRARRWWRGRWTGSGLQGTPSPALGQRWAPRPIGEATPLLPPERSWQRADGGGFWGPSLSWNTAAGAFLLLLNKVNDARRFDADGNWLAWIPDAARPTVTPPLRLDGLPYAPPAGWYVQAMGDPTARGTSALTGDGARLFVGDRSFVRLRFRTAP